MRRISVFAALLVAVLHPVTAAQAALQVNLNTNVSAGMAAFGTATPLLSWANAFGPAASWTTGVFGGDAIASFSVIDGVTGARSSGSHFVTNWIDGPGFGIGAAAGPDLGINGVEDFTLTFTTAVSRIGFAISTGRGLLPGEFDNAGARFAIATNGGDAGTLTLVDGGNGLVAWVDIIAANPFTSISFAETGGSLTDQYFGNIVSGTPAGVPEPAAWAMLLGGFGAIGVAMRRRPAVRAVAS